MTDPECDGRHVSKLINVMDRFCAGVRARSLSSGADAASVTQALINLNDEYGAAKDEANACSVCRARWDQLLNVRTA